MERDRFEQREQAVEYEVYLFEIVPEQIYTKADLNWQDQNSRSSVEMKDRSCRPAIASKVDDMTQYDVVFVGFPVK